MDTEKLVMAALVAVAIVIVAIGGFALASGLTVSVNDTDSPSPNQQTTQEPANESDLSDEARASVDGATLLKEKMVAAGYEDARVFVQNDGQIGVMFTPKDPNAVEQEMHDVAFMYSEVVAEHPKTGGLTISVDGASMLVSQSTAVAHANGDINDEAFKETLVITSGGNSTEA